MGLFDSLFQSKSTGVMSPEQLYATTGQVAPASTKQPGTFLGMSRDDWRYTLGGIGSALSTPGSIGDRLGQFGMQRAQNSWGAEQQGLRDTQQQEFIKAINGKTLASTTPSPVDAQLGVLPKPTNRIQTKWDDPALALAAYYNSGF